MEGNFGIYAGIVIQNSDPEKAGRVKVYVPGINDSVYNGWTEESTDKEFSFIDGSILNILDQLREDLPWAPCATGLLGGNTSSLSVADSPVPLSRPSDAKVKSPPEDAFGAKNYTPGDYSGTAGGTYAIPNIGAHVYVFFRTGNPMFPVYFTSSHNKEDWEDIYKDNNYPTDHELDNSGTPINVIATNGFAVGDTKFPCIKVGDSITIDKASNNPLFNGTFTVLAVLLPGKVTFQIDYTGSIPLISKDAILISPTHYTGKQVFNTNKHTLEFIDTDCVEEVRLSHFSGSNIRMLNNYNSRYSVNDDYTLIENDKFETIGNNANIKVGNDISIIVDNETRVLSVNTVTINCNNGNSVLVLNPDGTVYMSGTTQISLTAPQIDINGSTGVTVNAPDIALNGTTALTVTAPDISLLGAVEVKVLAPLIDLTATTMITAKAPIIDITAGNLLNLRAGNVISLIAPIII